MAKKSRKPRDEDRHEGITDLRFDHYDVVNRKVLYWRPMTEAEQRSQGLTVYPPRRKR
jgi:hypothetical protein